MEPEDPLAGIFADEGEVGAAAPASPVGVDDPLAGIFADEQQAAEQPAEDDSILTSALNYASAKASGAYDKVAGLTDYISKDYDKTKASLQNATYDDAATTASSGLDVPVDSWLMRNTGAKDYRDALDNPIRTLLTFQGRQMMDAMDPLGVSDLVAAEVGTQILGDTYSLPKHAVELVSGKPLKEWAKKGSKIGDAARWVYSQSGRRWMEQDELTELQKANPVEAAAQARAQHGALLATWEGLSDLVHMPVRIPAMVHGVATAKDSGAAAAQAGAAMYAQGAQVAGRAAVGNLAGAVAHDPVGATLELAGAAGKGARLNAASNIAVAAPGGSLSKAGALAKGYWSRQAKADARAAMDETVTASGNLIREIGHTTRQAGGQPAAIFQAAVLGDPRPIMKVAADQFTPMADSPAAAPRIVRQGAIQEAGIVARLEDGIGKHLDNMGVKEGFIGRTTKRARNKALVPDEDLARPFIESHQLVKETASPGALKEFLDVARKVELALEEGLTNTPQKLHDIFSTGKRLARSPDFVRLLREDDRVMDFANRATDGQAAGLTLRLMEAQDPMSIGGRSASSLEGIAAMMELVNQKRTLPQILNEVNPNPNVVGSADFLANQKLFAEAVLEPLVRKGVMSRVEALGHALHSNVTAEAGMRSIDPTPAMTQMAAAAANFKLSEALAELVARDKPPLMVGFEEVGPLAKFVAAKTGADINPVRRFDIFDRALNYGRTDSSLRNTRGQLARMKDGSRWFQPDPNAKDWGALAGKWIPQDTAAKFAEMAGMQANVLDKARGWLSRNWVIYNPKSHVSALGGDLMVLAANGVANPMGAMKRWSLAMTGKAKSGMDQAKLKMARENGVTAGSQLAFIDPESAKVKTAKMDLDDMMDIGKQLELHDLADWVGVKAEVLFGGAGLFEAMFNAREQAYRMALWDSEYTRLHLRKHGSKPDTPRALDPTLAAEASEYALAQGLDYVNTPTGTRIRWGGRDISLNAVATSSILPFMRYSQAATAALTRAGMQQTVSHGLSPQAMFRAARGEMATNEDFLNQTPEQRRGRATVRFGDMEWNAKSINPAASVVTDVKEILESRDPREAVPVLRVLDDLTRNRGYNGQEIYFQHDSPKEKAAKSIQYLTFQLAMPRWATSLEGTRRAVGTRDQLGREYSLTRDVIQKFINVSFDVNKRQLEYIEAQRARFQRDMKSVKARAKQEPAEYVKASSGASKAFYKRFIQGWPD